YIYAKSEGYTALSDKGGMEALALAKLWGKPIHLLLTDIVMAHMRGPELAALLRSFYPVVKTIYMSGYQDYGASDAFEEGCLFVQKPFSRDNLLDVISQGLKTAPLEEHQPLSRIKLMFTVQIKPRRELGHRGKRRLAFWVMV